MQANNGYALIIGVNDYQAFDASTGQPAGTSDLAGSVNDARALYGMCRLLRIPAENIRVLASPRLRPEDLGDGATEANLGDATHDAILEGARWLAGKLDGPSRPTGILTWSGHGDFDEARGLVLCPTDTKGNNLQNAVPFTDLQGIFASPTCKDSLTVLLDCCNAGSSAESVPTARGTSLTGRPLPQKLAGKTPAISERMFCATQAGQPAYQAHFDGQARGAFSWAVSVAAEQWKLGDDNGYVYLTLSHDELLSRAQRLLDALSIQQQPALVAPARVAKMPVFRRGVLPHAGEASADPTRSRSRIQLTGDIKIQTPGGLVDSDYVLYTLTLDGGTPLGQVLVTNTAGHDAQGHEYNAKTEYWSMVTGSVNGAESMTIVGVGGLWDDAPSTFPGRESLPMFSMPELVPWSCSWSSTTAVGSFFAQPRDTNPRITIEWNLSYKDGWSGWVRWFQTVPNASEVEKTVLGQGTFTLTLVENPAPPEGYKTQGTEELKPIAQS